MEQSRVSKALRRILVLVLILSLGLQKSAQTGEAAGSGLTNQYIEEREAQIKQAQTQQKDLQSNMKDYKSQLQALKSKKADLTAYVEEIDAALLELDANIADLAVKIEDKEAEIVLVKQDLADAEATRLAQYEAMKVRIRFMYEEGDAYALEQIFSAHGFADALNKAEYIESISEYDRNKLQEYILNEKLIATMQTELESQEALLQEQKLALEDEKKEQEELQAIAEANVVAMQASIDETMETIESINAKIAAQNATIEALEAQVAAEKDRLAREQDYDGGSFTWPCPSCRQINSPFGMRYHPILKYNRLHNGIDIPGRAGADIVAAYEGKVVAVSYTSAMGNYVMIDHGSKLYTIYMHCSKTYVQVGQDVARGEKIAAVGKTGLATGNHLHFTVRKNGDYVDPTQYVSP